MKWFRFYHEFVDDPKNAMMSDSDQLLWVKALCLASDNRKNRGCIELTDEEICWRLRIDKKKWISARDEMLSRNLLEVIPGGYRFPSWEYDQKYRDRPPANVWRDMRAQVFERDGYKCQYCGTPTAAPHCDHIMPLSRGGSNDVGNLVTACARCNLSKHNKTIEEWRAQS